jgi:RHS repeat-associated protein
VYDADHNRTRQTTNNAPSGQATTIYYINPGNQPFFEKHIGVVGSGLTEYRHFIGGMAIYTQYSSAATTPVTKYLLKDHLGSTTVVTSSGGGVLERYSYDAFGKTRNLNGSDTASNVMTMPSTRRGFTGHEMLPEIGGGMIHMNGRIYDPNLGRFMTADPQIQFVGFSQSYNRYSYVLNNPLSFTDPSGYGIRDFFRSLDNAVRHPGDAQALYGAIRNRPDGGAHDRFMMRNSWARAIGYAVAAYYGGAYATAFISGYETYLAGGSNSDIFKSSATSYVTSSAFYGVGATSSAVGGVWGAVIKIVGHAAIGCASAEASGGSCRQGALANGVGAAATIAGNGDFVITVIGGGIGAELGGGKFANGAFSAAMGYVLNFCKTNGGCFDRMFKLGDSYFHYKFGGGTRVWDINPLYLDINNASISWHPETDTFKLDFQKNTDSYKVFGTLDKITIDSGGRINISSDEYGFELHYPLMSEPMRNLGTLGGQVFHGRGVEFPIHFRQGVVLPSATLNRFESVRSGTYFP